MGRKEPDQLEADRPPRGGLFEGPRRIEGIVVEPESLGDVLVRGGEPGELEIDVAIFGLRLPQTQKNAAGALVIALERQRLREREHVSLVVRIANGGSTEGVESRGQLAGLGNRLLDAPEPLRGVPKAHLTVADRDGWREERCPNGDCDEAGAEAGKSHGG